MTTARDIYRESGSIFIAGSTLCTDQQMDMRRVRRRELGARPGEPLAALLPLHRVQGGQQGADHI